MTRSRTRLARWGAGFAVRIPKAIIEAAQLKPGDELELELQGRAIVIRPMSSMPTLQQLLDAITPENCHAPTDWGQPVGKEAW